MLTPKFIPFDSQEYIEQLTKKFRDKFNVARIDQRFEPLVIPDKNIPSSTQNKVLIIQLFKSYDDASFGLLEYDQETHILGMSLRLLVHLHENYKLYQYLNDEGIVRIIVTTASDTQYLTKSNKWVFDTVESITLVKQLIILRNQGKHYMDSGIEAMVRENAINS